MIPFHQIISKKSPQHVRREQKPTEVSDRLGQLPTFNYDILLLRIYNKYLIIEHIHFH